jgi:hypothetical protein
LRGFNDDCITATAGALWLFENAFKQVKAAQETSKVMLNAWIAGDTNRPQEKDIKSTLNNGMYQNGQDMSSFMWLLK